MKKRNWSKVADELCACGHKKSQHGDTFAEGHSPCMAVDIQTCPCDRFTWAAFLDKNGRKI